MREEKIQAVVFGSLSLSLKASFPDKLKILHDQLSKIISNYKANTLAIETLFYSKNVSTSIKLSHARGVIIITALNSGMNVVEYTPMEIKNTITGSGMASKDQVMKMVVHLLGIRRELSADTSDALAIALCHAYRISSWKGYDRGNKGKAQL